MPGLRLLEMERALVGCSWTGDLLRSGELMLKKNAQDDGACVSAALLGMTLQPVVVHVRNEVEIVDFIGQGHVKSLAASADHLTICMRSRHRICNRSSWQRQWASCSGAVRPKRVRKSARVV